MSIEGAALVGRRLPPATSRPVLTNFYPLYDGDNDQVDPVTAVRRTIFQRVIPRYRLSTSETRDEGLGPDFIYAPVREFAHRRQPTEGAVDAGAETRVEAGTKKAAAGASPTNLYRLDVSAPTPSEPWLGRRANLYV